MLSDLWDKFSSKKPGVMSKREEEEYRKEEKRLKEISIAPSETLKSLRIGEHKLADNYLRDVYYLYAQLRIKHAKELLPAEFLEVFSGPVESILQMYSGKSIYGLSEVAFEGAESAFICPIDWEPASLGWKVGRYADINSDFENEEIRGFEIESEEAREIAQRYLESVYTRAREFSPHLEDASDNGIDKELMSIAFLEEIVPYRNLCGKNSDADLVLEECLTDAQRSLMPLVPRYCFLKWAMFWAELGHGHRLG